MKKLTAENQTLDLKKQANNLEQLMDNFDIEELEERLEFAQVSSATLGWDYGSGCSDPSWVCYKDVF